MKKLTLFFLLLMVLLAVPKVCPAQGATFPYIFTGTPLTCFPQTNCVNLLYVPQGWYGSVYEVGAIQCYQSLPWAQGYRLNLLIQEQAACARSNMLLEAYLYTTTKWNYAPGNPWTTNNVIWASALQAVGVVYAIINNGYYLAGSEYLIDDCFTGTQIQSGGSGGTC
jgi:hypothetical protein